MPMALQYPDSSAQDKVLQTAFRPVCTGELVLVSSHQSMQRLGQSPTLDAGNALRLVEKKKYACGICHVISAGPASARVI